MAGIDFTPLNTIANNLLIILQAIGAAMLVVGFAIIGIMKLTAFGNEHKTTLVKSAGTDLVLGFIVLIAAPILTKFLQGALAFLATSH